MSNAYLIAAIVFALILGGWAYFRKKEQAQTYGPLVLFHTKKGVGYIDKIAKLSPTFWRIFGTIGVIAGFFFMIDIAFGIYQSAVHIIKTPTAAAGAALVLPGLKIMGIKIPVLGWFIGVLSLLVSHELSHGILARAENIKVKTVGAVFLGFLPIGAFVNPDEKNLLKQTTMKQLRIFAAGSFMNILLSMILVAIMIFAVLPVATAHIQGVQLTSIEKNSPAEKAGLEVGMSITEVEGTEINGLLEFNKFWTTKGYKAGDTVNFVANGENFEVDLADRGDGFGKAGIVFCGKGVEKMNYPYGFLAPFVMVGQQQACQQAGAPIWLLYEVLLWAAIINFGVGIVNLLPIKPLDGGLMLEAVVKKVVKDAVIVRKTVLAVSLVFFFLLLINFIGPHIRNLIT